MFKRSVLLVVCGILLGAAAIPAYELLPAKSVYLVNRTEHSISFILEKDGRAVVRKLLGGDSMIYLIPGTTNSSVVVKVSTGGKIVQYELKSERRYVFYWNANDARFDVGLLNSP